MEGMKLNIKFYTLSIKYAVCTYLSPKPEKSFQDLNTWRVDAFVGENVFLNDTLS